MKFDIDEMAVKSPDALYRLVCWVDNFGTIFDRQDLLVFVDSNKDFVAVEFCKKEIVHINRSHSLTDCFTSRYYPLKVPFYVFRQRVQDLAYNDLNDCGT